MSRHQNSEFTVSNQRIHNGNDDGEWTETEDLQQQLSTIEHAVTRYLAQREHGFKELIHRLVQKGFTEALVEKVVQDFANRDWQSDERYANSLIKRRIDKKYGQRFISGECQSKGLDSELVNRTLEALNIDWYDIAYQCAQRKFGDQDPSDHKTQRKQYQFLIQRGFCSDIIRVVLQDLHKAKGL